MLNPNFYDEHLVDEWRPSSPPLEPVQPKYRHEDTPPPLVSAQDSDTAASEEERDDGGGGGKAVASGGNRYKSGRKRRRKRRQSQPGIGDESLLSNLAPTQPHLARDLAQKTLPCGSDYDSEDDSMSVEVEESQNTALKASRGQDVVDRDVRMTEAMGVDDGGRALEVHHHSRRSDYQNFSTPPLPNGSYINGHRPPDQVDHSQSTHTAPKTPLLYDVKPPPVLHAKSPLSSLNVDTSRWRSGKDSSLLNSPAIGRFALSSSVEGDPNSDLPTMSPPRSSSGYSPDSGYTLPSLQTALSLEFISSPGAFPMSSQSPPMSRPSPGQPLSWAPSPATYSQPSPAMPTQLDYSHPSKVRENTTAPSEYSYSTPGSVATPATTTSSSSYATSAGPLSDVHHARTFSYSQSHNMSDDSKPTLSALGGKASHYSRTNGKHHISPPRHQHQPGANRIPSETQPVERIMKQESRSPTANDSIITDANTADRQNSTSPEPNSNPTSASGSSGNLYKCDFPGCIAAAFGTQYLLNSHTNVHSSSRPHFCPVRGCNRGPGGMGFKRKNEMIRHGLVHSSPGYICPFCPDQQHRYPRPDNLQRHVRVHHVDRDRDDPLLREVLAQRTAASGGGGGAGSSGPLLDGRGDHAFQQNPGGGAGANNGLFDGASSAGGSNAVVGLGVLNG